MYPARTFRRSLLSSLQLCRRVAIEKMKCSHRSCPVGSDFRLLRPKSQTNGTHRPLPSLIATNSQLQVYPGEDRYSSSGPTLQLAADTVGSRLRRPTTC